MKKILFAALAVGALGAFILAGWVVLVLSDLPDVSPLRNYRPAAAAEVLDRNGNILTQYFDRKFRIWVPISSLPDRVIHAVVTAEDDTFFGHNGVNYKAAWDALVHDVQKRRFARGGSTITQQMIKNVLLSREKTLTRKVREYVLARRAEEILTKRQILQIYLNEVEWGDGIYGIEAASRFYLGKHAPDLSSAEAALLAGMLPNPRYYNPYKRPEKAKKRQEQVLFNLFQAKWIGAEEYEAGLRAPLGLRQESGASLVPALSTSSANQCCRAALERILLRLFENQNIYRGGWTVRTTLDRDLQEELRTLEVAATGGLPDLVTVVSQEGQIRAISCSFGKESSVREKADGVLSGQEYEVVALPLDGITRDQIVLEADGEKK